MAKRRERADKQPRQAPSLQGIERRLAQMQAHLLQNDIRIKGLERKLKDVTAEKDDFKRRYHRSLDRIREQDKQIEVLKLKLDSAENSWHGSEEINSVKAQKQMCRRIQPQSIAQPAPKRKRGQQPGSKGHGRTKRSLVDEEERLLDVTAAPVLAAGNHTNSCLKRMIRQSQK